MGAVAHRQWEESMRKSLLVIAAAVGLAVAAGPAMAQKKTLAVLVKGLDNAFFTAMGNGCADWNAANPDSEYECLYTGPALTSDEAGEIQLAADLIARDDVAGIAISPSNAPAMAKLLTEQADTIKAKGIAIMTIDADLLPADQGLRTTYFGTHNYGMGVAFCENLKELQPNGGKVALMFGNPAAENLNERGYGFRDCIQGEVMSAVDTKGRDPLTGQGGWTEVAPTFTNDDIATANQQFADVLAANPDLKAYVLLGGWAQQGCEAFNATGAQYADRFASGDLVVVAGDTVGCQLDTVRAGFSQVNVGQRPYQMGREAPDVMIKIINGEMVEDPIYTGLDICKPDNVDTCVAG
jgi:ribose transport system substrate-binding protein